MTSVTLKMILTALIVIATAAPATANIDAVLGIEDTRISSFYLAIGHHYKVDEEQIIVAKRRDIDDNELAVVFYLAEKARVKPTDVIKLRLDGRTWMEITVHFDLNAEIYYVPIKEANGPPYGRAHGYFKNRKREKWKAIQLSDADIINLVNLKFVSECYSLTADQVVKMRQEGQSFIAIHDKVIKAKAKKKSAADKKESKNKGKKKH